MAPFAGLGRWLGAIDFLLVSRVFRMLLIEIMVQKSLVELHFDMMDDPDLMGFLCSRDQ